MNLNDPGGQYNPYAAPAANAGFAPAGDYGDQIQAERITRLGAALLDSLLTMVCMIPAFVIMFAEVFEQMNKRHHGGLDTAFILMSTGLAFLFALPITAYQWYLITKTGQSLGKKWLGIKIVKLDGSPVDFVTGVVKRIWVIMVLGFVPYVGSCVGLVDILMIFGDQRRCLHDQIAGTKVILAR